MSRHVTSLVVTSTTHRSSPTSSLPATLTLSLSLSLSLSPCFFNEAHGSCPYYPSLLQHVGLSVRARGDLRATLLPLLFLFISFFFLLFPQARLPLLVGSVLSTLLHHPSSSRANSRQPPLETTLCDSNSHLSIAVTPFVFSPPRFVHRPRVPPLALFVSRVFASEFARRLFFSPCYASFSVARSRSSSTFEQRKSRGLDDGV